MILLGVAIVIPAFPVAGLYPSGPFAVVKGFLWTRAFEAGEPGPGFGALAIFAFALFSNLVFLLPPVAGRRRVVSWPAKMFVASAVVAAASLMFVLPVFALALGYWLWLAAIALVAWAGIGLRDTAPGDAPPPKGIIIRKRSLLAALVGKQVDTEVPLLIWIAFGWLLFWLAVTAIHLHGLDKRLIAAAQADEDAREATPLTRNFHDPGNLIEAADAVRIAHALAAFETATSNQLAVTVYPHLPQGALEEFTLRTAELSRLGKAGVDNGAILFIFPGDHVARLEVGYGLEGVLTDADTHRILEERLVPAFANGEHGAGIEKTVDAVMARIRDAYRNDKMPGEATILYRQLKAELPKVARKAWPVINDVGTGDRVGLSFFGTLILGILVSGLWEALRWAGATVVAARNLYRHRAIGAGIGKLEWAPLFDSTKILILMGIPVAAAVGAVIVAGGGTFGGAGATIRW